jgi:hypothetical protein
VVAIEGTTVTIDVDGEVRVYRNHATLRLAQLTFTLGPRVIIDEGWAILKLYQQSEELLFSIASADKEWTPCRAAGLSELDLCPLGEVRIVDGGADGRLIIGDPRE